MRYIAVKQKKQNIIKMQNIFYKKEENEKNQSIIICEEDRVF